MKVTIEKGPDGDELVIRFIIEPHLSKSGKTTMIATTGGFKTVNARYDDCPVVLNVSAYVSNLETNLQCYPTYKKHKT